MSDSVVVTERDAMTRAVLASPGDDTVRLVFADWLDEHGEHDRAEFIRVQVELARRGTWPEARAEIRQRAAIGNLSDDAASILLTVADTCPDRLQIRERDLLDHEGGQGRAWIRWAPKVTADGREVCANLCDPGGRPAVHFARGFVSRVECSAESWLAHADQLCWRPGWETACPKCEGRTWWHRDGADDDPRDVGGPMDCDRCLNDHGRLTGRVPRPFVATAQPITDVRITDGLPLDTPGWEGLRHVEGDPGYKCPRWPGVWFHFAGY